MDSPPLLEPWPPAWLSEASFWLAVASLVAITVAAVGIWSLVVQLRRLREESRRLATLESIDARLDRLVKDRGDLDLRRIEHVLIDVRDGLARMEEALVRTGERSRRHEQEGGSEDGLALPPSDESVAERVTNRLLALGFEQIQIITRTEKLIELLRNDGEVLVEARRGGVLHKGRIDMRSGRLTTVDMNPAYSIFP